MTDKNQRAGIDYGLGTTNLDPKTGIRFGVINQSEVLQAWADSSEAVYPETEEDESECAEPEGFKYLKDGYNAYQLGDDTDIFIEKSPFYTLCAFCSPCAPGAGYLMDTRKNGVKAYCFGHDWFDEGKAPYPVFSVETGELV